MKLPSIATPASKEVKSASRSTSHEKNHYAEAEEVQRISDYSKESATVSSSGRANSPPTKTTRQVDAKKLTSKKKAVESEEGRLERQGTLTIMNVDEGNSAQLLAPGPSQSNTAEKPKSVVKPMVKDPPLAGSAQKATTRAPLIRTGKEIKSATTAKSSIPKRISSSRTTSNKTVSTTESKATKTTRSLEPNRRPMNPNER